ncbi:hypothetical protein H5410_013598 [Solanum commersonii]|uniref:CCHC-type domain-containing protein n=1 Tax=Solanum commersonii TaxID=4109 RepID=A0A9J5ZNP3_SOLCO|nr:hypothetical protein H5410_013598 [Solanum commersonii]
MINCGFWWWRWQVFTWRLVVVIINNSDCACRFNMALTNDGGCDISISPLPDQNEWNVPGYIKDDIVRPPKHKKLPGRPSQKHHDKAYNELYGKKSKNSCSTCGLKGHNRHSCRNGSRIV